VIFGTVAAEYANSIFAPWRMMPPCSCATPGRKPGTSTRLITGMLYASQIRMNRAALSEALMSSTPDIDFGWLAMKPTERPTMRPKPVTMLVA